MLSLAASAVYPALMKSQVTNVLGGVLTFYFGDNGHDWGRSHARARRCFWRTTHRAASLAHVLWAVYRLRVLLPGTAASIPSLVTQNKRAFYPGYPATDIADFLAVPSSLHQRIQEKIHVARRCLLLTDLAFELTSQQDTGGRQ